MKKKRLKIVVGTNSLTEIQYPAYTNHCQFWFRLGRSYPDIDFIISNPSRMGIDRMRNMTAKVAIETKADYVLFLDDDVIVNPNYGLKQLLDCKADIATGKIVIRGYPFSYMAFLRGEKNSLQLCKTLPKTGIFPCDAVGFSFALIKVSLLKKVELPWFVTTLHSTEDVFFCVKAREVSPKCKIVVNCDCNCGHILWPEIMVEDNRDAYIDYFKHMNKILPEDNGVNIKTKRTKRATYESTIAKDVENMVVEG